MQNKMALATPMLIARYLCGLCLVFLEGCLMSSECHAEWKPHLVQQINGQADRIKMPGRYQLLTAKWDRIPKAPYMPQGYTPYIIYMPEKKRVLMQFNSGAKPIEANVITSDDGGNTWSQPRYITTDPDGKVKMGWAQSLTYLGRGEALFAASPTEALPTPFTNASYSIWFSNDYGETWGNPVPNPLLSSGRRWLNWDSLLVDRDPKTGKILRLAQTGYDAVDAEGNGYDGGFIRFSTDEGRTWSPEIKVPGWEGANEITLVRARNGDVVAACRTVLAERFAKAGVIDHYEGLAYSISKDNGQTWTKIEMLYQWGRHHPSMVLMPDGDLVMVYVVRKGYVDTKDGYPQFGVEAIVSRDNGKTWDLDHRYILSAWTGAYKSAGASGWYPSPQSTSSTRLPDGSILTVFSTGELSDEKQTRRDLALVCWQPNKDMKALNSDRTISSAPFDSDLRNVFDPAVPHVGKPDAPSK